MALARISSVRVAVAVTLAPLLVACTNPPARWGMVKDPATRLQFGSVVEKNLVTDASFYRNKKIKIRTRNTSGDTSFDLGQFTGRLRSEYASKGYDPSDSDDFGLLIDVNVMYSGQVQTNLANEFAFLGAAAGGIAGYRSDANAGTAIGVVSGATLGSIIGSFVTDDTYIIVARVTFGEVKTPRSKAEKTIIFSRSPKPSEDEDETEAKEERRAARGFKKTYTTGVSVFAGGRNVPQSRIAGEVRERIVRIVSDII